ncbi:LysR family transcriptional regulator [Mycobacterium sp. 21AC1]|uniref:LysR family transcriptional regulator n=1 Tax=[Mycobacterium] appelbergii TaxID=2939269 RepID=UPI0029393A3A|nr:LysR family transcriptional regulator [Mycobacterium sp. 21AC1]MDV3130019.1 LysR family transcriptional regulator [Mycobacterium sp. 21AC1]
MDLELRHLRCLVAISDHGGFTGAAAALGVSQPAVSRGLAALERELGVRLLRRTSREVVPTAAGERVLARARRLLAEADDLVRDARGGIGRLRIGHAWAAMGAHTVEFQRRWAAGHPDIDLHLVRTNSPTGGLAEGACDVAVVRTSRDTPGIGDARFDDVIVGLESRYAAVAADDPLGRRRQLRLADLVDRVVAVDPRTGTTTPELWPLGSRPEVEEIHDVDDWLAVVAAGRCVGVTAQSTLTQYRRQGVVFRRLQDAPPVPVRLVWWRDDVHPATTDVVGLLSELYHRAAPSR